MLIYLQWLTSESRVMRDLLSTLAWDITMLLSGVWASFASSETLFYFAAGVACYAGYIVLEQQRTIYLESIKVFHHLPHTARALRNVYLFSTLSWCLFPIVWFMGKNDWISHNDEEALWCAADFLAKMCQSIALHQVPPPPPTLTCTGCPCPACRQHSCPAGLFPRCRACCPP